MSSRSTASLTLNNLSADSTSVAFVHISDVVVGPTSAAKTSTSQDPWKRTGLKEPLTQAKICNIGGVRFIVLTGQRSVQAIDPVEGKKLFSYTLPSATDRDVYASGIATASGTKHGNALLIGSTGGLLVFSVDRFKIVHEASLPEIAKAAITDVSSQDDSTKTTGGTHFAVGDLVGTVTVCLTSDFTAVASFPNNSLHACTSLRILNNFVYTGFQTGHLRIFNFSSRQIIAEIASHSRAINAIDLFSPPSPSSSVLVATGGEDSYVVVWELGGVGEQKVSTVLAVQSEDSLVTGVTFSADGSQVLASAYDKDALAVWDLPR